MNKVQTSPDFSFEKDFMGRKERICGVDEVGRGAWAGPVVAAAVILPLSMQLNGLTDSKKMSAKKRAYFYELLLEHAGIDIGIGWASVIEVDQYNVLQATFMAMQRAVYQIHKQHTVHHALIDGHIMCPALPCSATSIVRGDEKSLSIAAASVIAKVVRDHYMHMLSTLYPYYGWQSNVGYGVRVHKAGLEKFGVSPYHRYTFKPVQAVLKRKFHI